MTGHFLNVARARNRVKGAKMNTPKSQATDYPDRDPGFFFEIARDRLVTQLESIGSLDNKIGLLFSLGSALLGILAAVFAVRPEGLGAVAVASLIGSGFSYCFVAWHGIRAYLIQEWNVGPSLRQVWRDAWTDVDDALLKWRVANVYWSDYEKNQTAVRQKEDALIRVFAGIIVQSLLLAAALVLVAA